MSRRQSRVSADTRSTDTLQEFETFKKKFLLANKHITKLNSTLSVRIEELNAQISTLYVENLRLRASEIALTAQLKKEREKSRKILADAEVATYNLVKQFGLIRKTFNVRPSTPDGSPPENPPQQPRARRPAFDPTASPLPNRIARPPDVPGILEEDEMDFSSPVAQRQDYIRDYNTASSPTPTRRKKPRASTSSSSSRQPIRTSSPPPPLDVQVANFDEEISKAGKRKPTRRQSGLLTTSVSITTMTPKGFSTEVIPQRPASPAFGSPLRLQATMKEDGEILADAYREESPNYDESEEPLASVTRREQKRKSREKDKVKVGDYDDDDAAAVGESSRYEREKRRAKDYPDDPGNVFLGKKPKLKDVTNAPPPRPSLGTTIDRDRTPDSDTPTSATSSSSYASARAFLSTPRLDSYLPTPGASSPIPPPAPEADGVLPPGREMRSRKSINYAEPKLNTKLRKPDPPPAEQKRSTTGDGAARQSTGADDPVLAPSTSSTSSSDSAPAAGIKRKTSRVYVQADDDSDGVQADAEAGVEESTAWANVNSRRRSHAGSGARRLETDAGRRHTMAV